MKGSQMPQTYVSALERLKTTTTWQGIANYLTDALDDERTVFRSEVWKMVKQGKRSPKVMEALKASGEIPGPKKRFRLHAEFQSREEIERFKDFYNLSNTHGPTFTDLTLDTWEFDQRNTRDEPIY